MSDKVGPLIRSSWSWDYTNIRYYVNERVTLHRNNLLVMQVYTNILYPCLKDRRGDVSRWNDTTRQFELVYVSVPFNRSGSLYLTDVFSALGWLVCTADPLPPFDGEQDEIGEWLNVYYRRLILFAKMCYTIGEQLTRNRAVLNPNGDWLGPHIAHILVTVDHSPLLVTGNTQFQSTEPPPPPPHQYALSTSIPYSASRDAITQTRQMSFQQNHGQIEEFWRLQSDLNKERPPGRFPPGMCGENQALQSLYLANGPLYAFGAALVINNHDFMDQDLFPSVAATKANARVAFGPCQTCQNLYRFANVIFYDIATGWVYGPPPPPDRPLGPAWKLFHKCQLYNCMNDCQKCDRSKVFRCPKGCVASCTVVRQISL